MKTKEELLAEAIALCDTFIPSLWRKETVRRVARDVYEPAFAERDAEIAEQGVTIDGLMQVVAERDAEIARLKAAAPKRLSREAMLAIAAGLIRHPAVGTVEEEREAVRKDRSAFSYQVGAVVATIDALRVAIYGDDRSDEALYERVAADYAAGKADVQVDTAGAGRGCGRVSPTGNRESEIQDGSAPAELTDEEIQAEWVFLKCGVWVQCTDAIAIQLARWAIAETQRRGGCGPDGYAVWKEVVYWLDKYSDDNECRKSFVSWYNQHITTHAAVEKPLKEEIERLNKLACRLNGELIVARQELADAKKRIAELEVDRKVLKEAFDCVDRVFQIDSTKPEPILPHFCSPGEDKFEAVVKLAEKYKELEQKLAAAEKDAQRWNFFMDHGKASKPHSDWVFVLTVAADSHRAEHIFTAAVDAAIAKEKQ